MENALPVAPVERLVSQPLPLDSIVCGDNVSVMSVFPDASIDLVVTSPPYDDLRTYNDYRWHFPRLAYELSRVIKDGGVIVWIVADETKDGSETGSSLMQALHFKDKVGLNLHDTMIYHKPQLKFPRYGHRKYCGAWEFMFVFSKGQPKTFNPIADSENSCAGDRMTPSVRQVDGTIKQSHSYGRTYADVGQRNNVWPYLIGSGHSTTDAVAFKHPAIFPEALARDHILSWSNEGDIVLDPFNGSGTTTKMARLMGRRFIGIDVNESYCEIARKRLAQKLLDFGDAG